MHLSIQDRPTEAQAIRVIHASLDAGVTLIDTANVYCLDQTDLGHNERLIARALAVWPGARDRVLVATKGGMTRPGGRWERDGRPASLERACDESLKALGVERSISTNSMRPIPRYRLRRASAPWRASRERGKIRWIGLSNVSVSQIREAQAIVPIVSVQNRLNPFFREAIADGVVEYCARQKIGFLAYSPTGGGRLNRKLPEHAVLRVMSNDLGFSPHALVLAWVLAQGPTVIAIPSARRVEHAMDAARAADIVLSATRDLLRITEAERDVNGERGRDTPVHAPYLSGMPPVARRTTSTAWIGRVPVGSCHPVVVQSMTNTDTADVVGTVRQVADLARAGSELVRVTVNNDEAAAAVPEIAEGLDRIGVSVPIVGDFHYNGHLLLTRHPECARTLDQVPHQPG